MDTTREYIKPSTMHDDSIEWAKCQYMLWYAEKRHESIRIYTRVRHHIDAYRCIDTDGQTYTLDNWTLHGELIYFKSGRYDWKTISFDDVTRIEAIEGVNA